MKEARIRFYARLALIAKAKEIIYTFWGKPSIKDCIESLGVPHTEVYLIVKNHTIVSFSDSLEHQDYISVYPKWFGDFDFHNIIYNFEEYRIKKEMDTISSFIADVHLGKLTKWLRFLGIDVLYHPYWSDSEIIQIALKEKRIILTQDKGILKHKNVHFGYYVISRYFWEQLQEVLEFFSLSIHPFSRCSVCNSSLHLVFRDHLPTLLLKTIPDSIRKQYKEFYICMLCKKAYWKGTHYQNILKYLNKLI